MANATPRLIIKPAWNFEKFLPELSRNLLIGGGVGAVFLGMVNLSVLQALKVPHRPLAVFAANFTVWALIAGVGSYFVRRRECLSSEYRFMGDHMEFTRSKSRRWRSIAYREITKVEVEDPARLETEGFGNILLTMRDRKDAEGDLPGLLIPDVEHADVVVEQIRAVIPHP